jgi:DNA-binding GntR family transcriptional regulator
VSKVTNLSGTDHLHRRVHRLLADEIATGSFAPGERLPSERELCQQLDVSRATVRRALRTLADAGLVEAHAGRGTFVSAGPLGEPVSALQSFTELGVSRGLEPSARVLGATVRPADLDEAEAFVVAPGTSLFVLERLRMLDSLPVSIDYSRVPLTRAPSLAELDFSTASLYEALGAAGVGPVWADYTVYAIAADRRRARLLGVEPGSPLLETETVAYDSSGRIIEMAEMAYRGDRYRFRARLTRRRG